MFEASGTSDGGFEDCEGFEELFDDFGGGDKLAWGACGAVFRLFLVEPSVTELLFRRSLFLPVFAPREARDEACRAHADSTAAVTLG